ncbi:hypothetical protein PXK01_11705 [Phaeobacter sp. PT47_59]|uniref:hypothetical protein n=1 Tax=Phaeobacter sp. PT47_59 TaxID=3029979 RepID=UPI002380C1AC|nr:hypothetical protein [Phaeobacter sp. PT47_59]MDE4174824.1 hypothetical protein [Phaeobacter sp. PT47_59]
MEGVIHIPAGEHGAIRLFRLDMRPEQAAFLKEPGALAQVLGIDMLDMEQVDIFPVSDLEEIGLTGYLTEGMGVPEEQVAADRERLDALDGHVMAIRSRAFGGREMRLTPADQIQLFATYGIPGTTWTAPPIKTDSAKPYSAPKLPPRQARAEARRIGATLFAVVMGLIFLVLYLLVA